MLNVTKPHLLVIGNPQGGFHAGAVPAKAPMSNKSIKEILKLMDEYIQPGRESELYKTLFKNCFDSPITGPKKRYCEPCDSYTHDADHCYNRPTTDGWCPTCRTPGFTHQTNCYYFKANYCYKCRLIECGRHDKRTDFLLNEFEKILE